MAEPQRVVIPYAPRQKFLPFHNRQQRWSAIVAHRRAGKTVACINDLIKGALTCERKDPRFAYLAPYLKQAKDIAWQYVKEYAGVIPGVEFNETELRADFPNGGRVRLYGADRAEGLRGIYLDGIVLDEFADMDPTVWTQVLRPALSDRKGWAVFIGTPKGKNTFYDLWKEAEKSEDWLPLMLKASETGYVDQEELDEARKMMPEDDYLQEYECSFEAAVKGAYYGDLINEAEKARIGKVEYDPVVPVHTSWDLGIGDSTAIWFWQFVGQEVHLIDYYETSGAALDHYVKHLQSKPYVYGRHILPHDARAKELGTGKSREEVLNGLGLRVDICPDHRVDDGIQMTRTIIPRCWFDAEKCARGIEALRMYRKEWDDKLQIFKTRPLHDWSSHGADSFRYGVMGLDKPMPAQSYKRANKGWIV